MLTVAGIGGADGVWQFREPEKKEWKNITDGLDMKENHFIRFVPKIASGFDLGFVNFTSGNSLVLFEFKFVKIPN